MSPNFKSALYLFVILAILFIAGNFSNFDFNSNISSPSPSPLPQGERDISLDSDCETLSGAELFLKCGKQNINIVDEKTLSSISGISKNLAKDIVLKRTEFNKFKNWNDVKKVNGVGEKRLSILRDYLIVN